MATVLKDDFSARKHLSAARKALLAAQAELAAAASRFKVFVGVIGFIMLGVLLAYGFTRYALWALEGALLLGLTWWAVLVAPHVIGAHRVRTQLRAVELGLAGEEAVAETLAAGLPADYCIINDVTLAKESQETQLDHVVVTPTEVLCIETKNWRGIYSPGRTGWLWQPLHRPKKPRWHKDPQAQAQMHGRLLDDHLKRTGIRVNVQALVVLVDPESKWLGPTNERHCPVLYLANLLAFIKNRHQGAPLGDEQQRVTQAILNAHIDRGDKQ